MKKHFPSITVFFLFIASLFLSSCTEEAQRGLRAVPTAFGNLNEIVVIMDTDLWDGPLGDTIRYYYSSAYPLLPQPEPIFDLRQFTPEELEAERLRKELRTYMFVGNLSDANSPTTKMIIRDIGEEKARRAREDTAFNSIIGRDKWAKGQLVIYQFANSFDELSANLKENFPAVKKRVHEFDSKKLGAYVYLGGENKKLEEQIRTSMGVNLKVPSDYFLAINDGNIIWIRKETDVISSNIMMKKVKYTDQAQLTKEYLLALRDSIGRHYISSTLPDTYMQVNAIDLPVLSSPTKINGYYAIDARGIWEIVNDYMGGAFVSYLILNPNTSELLFIDGFLHAPGEDKRDFMMQLEHVVKTVKF
ncbi:MAG: DUF4837 family protein [Phaeodactylibacter sp.]|nr:DUF4837 family protein [Phaeodactylibacter sp.]MCB9272654.1 DUF4837 family protein [Lewinellaceae bacterium]